MTNKEAIAILERKTTIPGDGYTWEQIEEAINVAVTAIKANQIGSEPLKYEQLRKMDGQVVREVIEDNGNIYEYLMLVNARDKDCIWLFDNYFHSGPYHNDDEFKEEGFTIYPYNPAHIDREAWIAKWEWFDEEIGNPIDGIEREWGWKCSKCGNALPDDFDNPDDTPKIEFCPFCGRAMTPRAWAELEKRLRG